MIPRALSFRCASIVRNYSSTAFRLSFQFNSPAEKVFRELMKPNLSFEECVNLYEKSNTKSMSLTTLMITLCSKHKRSEMESWKYIEELKHDILNFDESSASSTPIRTIDIVLSTLLEVEAYDDVVNLVRKLGNSSLASLKSFRLDQILKLLSSYSNSFELDIAKRIFSVLIERKQASVYAYNYFAQCLFKYEFEEGMALLYEMKAQQMKILDNTYISALTNSLKDNHNESRMICSMIENSKTSNKVLLATIVNFYNKCEEYDKAIQIIGSVKPGGMDTTLFNCLIQSYIGKGDFIRAIEVIDEMERQDISPDSATLSILLTACADNNNYEQGLKVLSFKNKIKHINIRFQNACINFYNKCGKYEKAIEVFGSISKDRLDATSFNCLIQSYIGIGDLERATEIVDDMQQQNVSPDSATLCIILTACADNKNFEQGLKMINMVEENKLSNSHLLASIMNFYNKCEKYDDAIQLFEGISTDSSDSSCYNCLIQSYIGKGDLNRAIEIIEDQNISPNSTTMSIIITACANNKNYEQGLKMINIVEENKLSNNYLLTSILNFYNKCDKYDKAIELFESVSKDTLDTRCYNSIVQSYIGVGDLDRSLGILNEMQQISPDPAALSIMLTNIITACANNKNYEKGLKMINIVEENKLSNNYLLTSILNFYNKCEKYDKAIELSESISKDKLCTASFNCLIQSFIGTGDLERAFEIFNHMKKYSSSQPTVIPDSTTYLVLLMGCATLVSPTKGKILIKEIQEKQLDNSEIIKSAMLTFYSNTLNHKKTSEMITDILNNNPSVISFNCVLASYARHGLGTKALSLFNKMIKDGVQMNGETITIVLNALSHTGMVEEAKNIYNSIESLKIIASPSHKTVMIDVYARVGLFNQAEQLIGDSSDAIHWRTLMAGCRKYNNSELAEKIFETLTKIDPKDASPYILLSNIFMFKGNTSKANEIRDLMVKRDIKKIPGIVYHEDNGKTYQFISGSSDYPLFEEVENKRKEIFEKIIEAGYVADTRCVTNGQIMSGNEKIDSLFRHAEKLAISHAFVLQPNRKKILLSTNLRVCNDCHNAIAFISKLMNVEIIVKDANRYHHFKNGKCSCNDYW